MTIREISFAISDALGEATATWSSTLGGVEPDIDKQNDAVFYQGLGFIAKVSYKGFEADIYCDGDMKAYNNKTGSTLRTFNDFESEGIDTDEKLREANDREVLNWDMNPWFDLYVYGEHLDNVQHTLYDALSSASAYVIEQHAEAEKFEK